MRPLSICSPHLPPSDPLCSFSQPERLSLQTVQAAETLLRAAQLETMGDEMWPFLEQVAIAALDCGRRELAEVSHVTRVLSERERLGHWEEAARMGHSLELL